MGSLPTIKGSLLELINKAPELAQTGSDELYHFESPEDRFVEVAIGYVDRDEITHLSVTLRTPPYENHISHAYAFFGSPDDCTFMLHPSTGKHVRVNVSGSIIPFLSTYGIIGEGVNDHQLGKILFELGVIPDEKDLRRRGRSWKTLQVTPEQAQNAFAWASSYHLQPVLLSQGANTSICVADHLPRYRSYTFSLRDALAHEVDGLEQHLAKKPFNLHLADIPFVPKITASDEGSIEPQTSA